MIDQDEMIREEVLRAASRLGEPSISCTVEDGEVILEGPVDSDEHAYELESAARAISGVRAVRNDLMVNGFSATVENFAEGVDLTPDFNAEVGSDDPLESASEAEPYFPPTDPVITTSGGTADDVEILNGFAGSSDEEGEGEVRLTRPQGDEEIRDQVVGALRMDATTTDLNLEVEVQDAIVTLRGTVPTIDDVENAESVAAGVYGVQEVQEELEVEGL